jgi:DNA repair ATPase RecN
MATQNEQALNETSSQPGFKTAERTAAPALSLNDSLDKLSRVGGFDLLETTIDGLQNLNPERKARKQIFLTDDEKKLEREELKQKLNQWIEALETGGSVGEMVEKSTEKLQSAEENLNKNVHTVLQSTRELEQAYRSLHLFYKNTEADKLKNVVLMNASLDQLKELDNPRFIEYVGNELKQNYDRLDLRQNYSIMVVPGYLGSNKVVERWSKMAFNAGDRFRRSGPAG